MKVTGNNIPRRTTVSTPLGKLRTDEASLRETSDQVSLSIPDAVMPFPEATRSALQQALEQSRSRVVESHAKGNLNDEGAAMGLEMLREMTDGLGYLARGEVEVISKAGGGDECKRLQFKTPTNDVFRVRARAHRDRRGQARIGISQVSDDGVEVPDALKLDVRLDRDPRRGATIDVEFGKAKLNRKIHGYKRDGGKKRFINHHFRSELPKGINRPDDFAELVHDFQNDTLAILG